MMDFLGTAEQDAEPTGNSAVLHCRR